MTYLRDGIEYLYEDEQVVYDAIKAISLARRTTNNAQIARYTGISNTRVGVLTTELRMRGFIHNVSKGAAYHWRATAQPVPYSRADRDRDRALARRARELNEGIRAEAIEQVKALGDTAPLLLGADAPSVIAAEQAPHGWEVKTFDGQRLVGVGNFTDEQVARDIARKHREHGFTTRVRPAGVYGKVELSALYTEGS